MLKRKTNHILFIFNVLNKGATEVKMKEFHSFAMKASKFKGTRAAIRSS